jgi:hypothetical protein
MKRGSGKWSSAGSPRWSASTTKSAQERPAPVPVESGEVTAAPKSLSERIPTLSDVELHSLLGNARRVSAETANKKAEAAAELIPLIEAELARRVVTKAEAGVVRKKDRAVERATVKARKIATAAAEDAGKANTWTEDEED